eukprot:TRINITY_DN2579_c0_g1_i1.p1 TRINITY_DN2579_c0_g1~~TRINITY_DN2579_c0_g1_i1.p1  ORF type:complete len:390 (-),score=77.94 TRINITY_DN2579_c0_g1_i1:212-1381(-)
MVMSVARMLRVAVSFLLAVGFCQDAGTDKVQLYQVALNRCGEATVDPWMKSVLIELLGFAEGTCADQGYDVSIGQKEIPVPGVGAVKLAMYRKSEVEETTVAPSAFVKGQAFEVEDRKVTLHQIALSKCGEATVDPWMKSVLIELLGFAEGPCADQGYDVSMGQKEKSVPGVGAVKLAMYKKSGVEEPTAQPAESLKNQAFDVEGKVTLHQIALSKCGEAAVDPWMKSVLIELLGFAEGTCADQGYDVSIGQKEISVPGVGAVKLAMYSKSDVEETTVAPSSSVKGQAFEAADDKDTLHQIALSKCGEATVDPSMKSVLIELLGFAEGTCADQGYDVSMGQKDISVPGVGDVKLAMYKKSEVEETTVQPTDSVNDQDFGIDAPRRLLLV